MTEDPLKTVQDYNTLMERFKKMMDLVRKFPIKPRRYRRRGNEEWDVA